MHSLIAFAFVLGVLVFIHELGHYLAAKWRGIKVDTFSIGFGPKLWTWHDRTGTAWCISAIPLGGYVKPHGFEGPEDATPAQQAAWEKGRTFHEKGVGSRALVIVMGPLFNFLLAFILYVASFSFFGQPKLSDRIAQVMPDSAASRAGVKTGDVITAIGSLKMLNVGDVRSEASKRAGEVTTLQVRREGQILTLPITIGRDPAAKDAAHAGLMGVSFELQPGAPLRFKDAVVTGAQQVWDVTVQTLQGVGQMLTGQRSSRELGGAIRIAQLSGEVAHLGVASLLSFMAVLSINLGLINLFPIPILDGGRLVFYAFEAVLRRPVPRKLQEMAYYVGFALIAALFLFSTFNDLLNIGVFRWLRGA